MTAAQFAPKPAVQIFQHTLDIGDLKVWYGFFAPAKVPRPVIDRLQKAIANAVQSLDLPSRDLNPGGNTPAQFQARTKRDSRVNHRTPG